MIDDNPCYSLSCRGKFFFESRVLDRVAKATTLIAEKTVYDKLSEACTPKKLDLCNCFDMILACNRYRLMANIMLS